MKTSMPRVLLLSSVPLAAPWNGADKNLAQILVHADQQSHYLVQTSANEPWPADRVTTLRQAQVSAMPTPAQKRRVFNLILRHAQSVDLVHIVASLNRPTRWSGALLRMLRLASNRPIIHTAPSLGDLPLTQHHLFGDTTVVVSAHSYGQLQQHGAPGIVRVYPPLDLQRMRPAGNVAALSAQLRLGPRAVLYPAHYGMHSGIAQIIQAFARLPARLDDAVLVLACRAHRHQNPDEEERRVWALAAEAGITERLRVVRHVDDMPGLISATALTALVPDRLASKMDLPMVILEALALERPVVISERPPISEALFGGGLSVSYGAIDQLAAALTTLLDDPALRMQLAQQGRAEMLKLCDPAQLAASYQQIYYDVLTTPGRQVRGMQLP